MQGISQVSRAWLALCLSAPGQTAAWLSKCFLLQRGCLSTQYSAFAWGLYLSFPWLVSVGTTHRAAGVCGACCGWPCCRVLAVRLACSAVVEGRTVMLAPLLCPRFSCGAQLPLLEQMLAFLPSYHCGCYLGGLRLAGATALQIHLLQLPACLSQ